MLRIHMNTPKAPSVSRVPTDSQAAWANGYSEALRNGERIMNDMMSLLDATAKATIIGRNKKHFEVTEIRQKPKAPRTQNLMPCGHPKKYIVETFETNQKLCTLCGLKG